MPAKLPGTGKDMSSMGPFQESEITRISWLREDVVEQGGGVDLQSRRSSVQL